MFNSTVKSNEKILIDTLNDNILEYLTKNIDDNNNKLSTINLNQSVADDVSNINSSNYDKYKNKLFNGNHSLTIDLNDTMFPFCTLFYYSSNWNGTITVNYNNIANTYTIPTNQYSENFYLIYIAKEDINILLVSLSDLKKYLSDYTNGKFGYNIDISNFKDTKTIFINKDINNNLYFYTDNNPKNKTVIKLNCNKIKFLN